MNFTSQGDYFFLSKIGFCYVVADESSRQSMAETSIFERLLDSVGFIENKTQGKCNLLVCGDRTSISPNYVVDDSTAHVGFA